VRELEEPRVVERIDRGIRELGDRCEESVRGRRNAATDEDVLAAALVQARGECGQVRARVRDLEQIEEPGERRLVARIAGIDSHRLNTRSGLVSRIIASTSNTSRPCNPTRST